MCGEQNFSFDLLIIYLFAITCSIFLITAAPYFQLLTPIRFSLTELQLHH